MNQVDYLLNNLKIIQKAMNPKPITIEDIEKWEPDLIEKLLEDKQDSEWMN